MVSTTLNAPAGLITLHNGANAIIKSNVVSKKSNLAIMPLYLSDSDDTDVFDYGGVTKLITLTGVFIAETIAELKSWIDSIEAVQNGHQDTDANYPMMFNDDLRGSLYVKVKDFTSEWNEAEPTKINWSLKLVQSSTNA